MSHIARQPNVRPSYAARHTLARARGRQGRTPERVTPPASARLTPLKGHTPCSLGGMKPRHACVTVFLLAGAPLLGCAHAHGEASPPTTSSGRAPAHAAAVAPGVRSGVTEMQGSSEAASEATAVADHGAPATSPSVTCESAGAAMALPPLGAAVAVKPDGTPVGAEALALRGGMIGMPPGALFTSSTDVSEEAALSEPVKAPGGSPPTGQKVVAEHGRRRTFRSDLPYASTVRFFDAALAGYGFERADRDVGAASTSWHVRCAGGESADVTVRDVEPPTIEVVEWARR